MAQTEVNRFTTRHTAEGILSHVDGTANLLGYFPQDILGSFESLEFNN